MLHFYPLLNLRFSLFLMIFSFFATLFSQSLYAQAIPKIQESKESIAVENALGIYLTIPTLRDEKEKIILDGQHLKILYLDQLNPAWKKEKICQAVSWLLVGRLKASQGISKLFDQLSHVDQISLIFFKYQNQLSLGVDGKYIQRKKDRPTLRAKISRNKAQDLNIQQLKNILSNPEECEKNAEFFLDELWIDQNQ
jgi:hypothetical protein